MSDTKSEYEEIVLNSNKAALQLLKIEDYTSAKTYLDTCMNILSSKSLPNTQKLLGITLNNYGCYYKRQGFLDKSLQYFQRSIEASNEAGSNVSETFLNISNVLSQNSKHEEALQAAFKALKSLDSIRQQPQIALLAYKAMGTEFKFLGMQKESQKMFEKAKSLNQHQFGTPRRLNRDITTALTTNKSGRKLNFAKTNERKHRFMTRTPELEHTDRIFVDFIPAPVNFEGLLRKTNGKGERMSVGNRSITPKIMKVDGRRETVKSLNEKCRICRGKGRREKRNEVLTPVPRREKLSLPSTRSYSPFL